MAEAPDVELKTAIIARLKADASVAAFVGERVFDRVPDGHEVSPYLSMGPWSIGADDYDCISGVEITGQVDAWSWGPGIASAAAEVGRLADAIRRSLHDADLTLPDNALVALRWELTRILRDPDGVTNHAAITFTATIETP